jgi:hypothetical protein
MTTYMHRRFLMILLTAFIIVRWALPAEADSPSKPPVKAPSSVPYFVLLSDIRTSLESLSMYVMAYTVTHRRDIPDRIKDCIKTLDGDFAEAYKVTPMEQKSAMKELRFRFGELKPIAEDVYEMEELYGINVNEAAQKTLKAHAIMEEKIIKQALLRAEDNEVAPALPLFYAMESNLSNMLTRTLVYLREKDPAMAKAAMNDHMAISESLEAYMKAAKAMKIDAKLLLELKSYIVDAMRCTQDATEDFERLEPRLILFLGKVEGMVKLIPIPKTSPFSLRDS